MLKDARLLTGDDRFDTVQGAVLAAPTWWLDVPAGRRDAVHREPAG